MDLDRLYREHRPRALATLIRLLGDFDRAEEALQDAFAVAVERWPREGPPANPRAWLVSTARHKALDRLRREGTWSRKREELAYTAPASESPREPSEEPFPDDMLRLIFTCCHPALAPEARIALTLKTICGLDVEQIARAFLISPPTLAQRLVRAKNKIRKAGIPYAVPEPGELDERLEGVLRVVYLVFNEGYAATAGDHLVHRELTAEAIRLGRLLHELLPGEPEVPALLALMLLQDSRHAARTDAAGDLVLLEEQDRSLWDRASIREGLELVAEALSRGGAGFYALQAAIAAVHARATSPADTDWPQIAGLYELLLGRHPSPVVALNRAVAVAMARGPETGLALVDELAAEGSLAGYHLLWSARADLLRRLGRRDEAAGAYREALKRVEVEAERRFLERRLGELER